MAEVWVKLEAGYFAHPKTLRLRRAIGPDADVYPIRLWAWCATYSPAGSFDPQDVEIACGWTGEEGKLLKALTAVGFLEPGGGALHGWMERSGEALSHLEAKRQTERNRRAAIRRQEIEAAEKACGTRAARVEQPCYPVEERRVEESRGEQEEKRTENPEARARTHIQDSEHAPPSPPPAAPGARKPRAKHSYSEDFEAWWKHYPKPAGKFEAWQEWQALGSERPPVEALIAAVEAQKKSSKEWKDGFILDPCRWLKRRRWEDAPPPAQSPLSGAYHARS